MTGMEGIPDDVLAPGWYLCTYGYSRCSVRWDGELWHWGNVYLPVADQGGVTVIGTVTLNEGGV